MAAAESLRAAGNVWFKRSDITRAVRRYEAAAQCLDYLGPSATDEDKTRAGKAQVPVWLNNAQCRLKLNDFEKARVMCEKVLGFEPENTKALYRLGHRM